MNAPPQLETGLCPECGGENVADAARCWLCYGSLHPIQPKPSQADVLPGRPLPPPALTTAGQRAASQMMFAVLTVATLVLVALVGAGIFWEAQDSALLYFLLVTPALLATGIAALRGYQAEGEIQWLRTFRALLFSLAAVMLTVTVTALVFVALAVAAVIALIATCFGALTNGGA